MLAMCAMMNVVYFDTFSNQMGKVGLCFNSYNKL